MLTNKTAKKFSCRIRCDISRHEFAKKSKIINKAKLRPKKNVAPYCARSAKARATLSAKISIRNGLWIRYSRATGRSQ